MQRMTHLNLSSDERVPHCIGCCVDHLELRISEFSIIGFDDIITFYLVLFFEVSSKLCWASIVS